MSNVRDPQLDKLLSAATRPRPELDVLAEVASGLGYVLSLIHISRGQGLGRAKSQPAQCGVSRAKARLYVIGDRAAWGQRPYFRVLDQRLGAGSEAPSQ